MAISALCSERKSDDLRGISRDGKDIFALLHDGVRINRKEFLQSGSFQE